jgi:lysine N6-hydroxylase
MNTEKVYDLVGIGIGPFNLGLAALTQRINELDCLFIDSNKAFNWHPGLMLPTAKMQVPFYADLVTLADPTSPYSYMNYLKATGKLFRFAINESYFPYRSEYNDYCQWVVRQLNNLHFGYECKTIHYDKKQKMYYVSVLEKITAKIKTLTAKHLVIGVGSTPSMPDCAKGMHHPNVFHASEYLQHKHAALMHQRITIIGGGQSAAEIFQDLLPHVNNLQSLKWYTRSDRFYAMDYSKFALELSSPEYIRYFYHLPQHKKANILSQQHDLYKGINFSLIEDIYQQLYVLSLDSKNRMPELRANAELLSITKNAGNNFTLHLYHEETETTVDETTDVIILATGYQPARPNFIDGIRNVINWTESGDYAVNENYSIDNHHSIFVQNAEQHTHGFNSADLGLGPHRNATIINTIGRKTHYALHPGDTFQHF